MKILVIISMAFLLISPCRASGELTGTMGNAWTGLAEGLDLGQFPTGRSGQGGDNTVVVLRADPAFWKLDMVCASSLDQKTLLNAREWGEMKGFTAVINAGMYDTDYQTHVGHCSMPGHVNNPSVNQYQSVAAFGAKKGDNPPFRIFDLDIPGVSIKSISHDYDFVVQNLRLIKRPRENRWTQQPKIWSEAALGEDAQGRILFIFCSTAYSMHDLNDILLSLPLGLVSAQHLEGGPEAQMFVKHGELEMECVGGYETGFFEDDSNTNGWRVPVVFGLLPRGE